MPLSWNEIKSRALHFSKEWETEVSEDAEAKSFWDGFFHVFGISRRRVASFEHAVKTSSLPGSAAGGPGVKVGFIDLLWKGQLLIEHKSRGRSLDKAFQQAKDYFPGLKEAELPRYILVSDFARFRLYDLDAGTQQEFSLERLVDHVHLFGFMAGYQKRVYKEQDPVNIHAAELMGRLHDKLRANGYTGHPLELYLVRLVFLLFADDTAIWEKGIFYDYLDQRTAPDGSDLALHLAQLFEVLNTPEGERLKNLDESLAAFPYINGKLFAEHLRTAAFDSEMRRILLDCCGLDWGTISPAIFGSLFQSVMDEKARRNLGAHYTSEKNILKLIKPLFLDELWAEFERVKGSKPRLQQFHEKLSRLRFLDPACGCGNFLIVAYRELRLLELEVIKTLLFVHERLRAEVAAGAGVAVGLLVKCNVDRFYGIEYEEFPAQIAQVALWLIDHQMNMKVSETFGEYFVRLPLRKSATIKHGNALRVDWQSLIDPLPWEGGEPRYDYILGNPPFVGKKEQNKEQKEDMENILGGVNGAGILDYVTAWYIKAARYMQQTPTTRTAFVSTNSISQGEQVSVLWNELFGKYKVKIFYAHRTFSWSNEARGNAAVHVVIIGFSTIELDNKKIFEYENLKGEPHELQVQNINPYLVEGRDLFIENRKKSISCSPEINYGSFALDDGNYTLTESDKRSLLLLNPNAEKFIKEFIGGRELLRNEKRFCLWLLNADPTELNKIQPIKQRIDAVRKWRSSSDRATTKKLASTPTLFAEIRQPETNYLAFPTLSSVNRRYIPIAFLKPSVIASNQVYIIPNATLFTFGILTSLMHMAWVKYVCGRFKSDFRYSASIVYNNFPWPEAPTEKQTAAVEAAAQAVLDARAVFQNPPSGGRGASLADLYDPATMPPVLVKAHQQLDKAVDLCYRPQPFANETKRIEFLFELYDKYTAGLFAAEKEKAKKRKGGGSTTGRAPH